MPLSLYSATSRGFWIYTLFINVAFFGKIMRSATQTADIISRNFNLSLEFRLTLNDKLYTICMRLVDSFLPFFRSYRDKHGHAVFSLKRIRRHYIRSG